MGALQNYNEEVDGLVRAELFLQRTNNSRLLDDLNEGELEEIPLAEIAHDLHLDIN